MWNFIKKIFGRKSDALEIELHEAFTKIDTLLNEQNELLIEFNDTVKLLKESYAELNEVRESEIKCRLELSDLQDRYLDFMKEARIQQASKGATIEQCSGMIGRLYAKYTELVLEQSRTLTLEGNSDEANEMVRECEHFLEEYNLIFKTRSISTGLQRASH